MAKKPSATEVFIELQKEIQSKRFSAVYLLMGEENYFIDRTSQILEQSVVEESSKSFNQHIVYGKHVTPNDIISISRRYPMMSDYQLVLVKEAQDVKDLEQLGTYLENPLPSTVLVIALRKPKIDMRSKFAKLATKFKVAEFAPLRDYQIKDWLPKYAESNGKRIDSDAVNRLIDLMGADLSKIHNELDKIFASVNENFIRVNHIDEHVGFNREYNIFELQSALGTRNFNKAIQIAHQMGKTADKGELMGSLALLHKYFNNIILMHGMNTADKNEIAKVLGVNPYFVDEYYRAKSLFNLADLQKVMNHLKYLDLRLKGINRGAATDGDLLVETVVNILSK